MSSDYPANEDFQVDDLTWREQEVLLLLADRCSNREIADQLHLAETTVKDYVSKILSKLYVKNRRQAVERARELGLFEAHERDQASPIINLPAEPTPFVGRTRELEQIKRQLAEARLLTLVGPGGSGKTRLAVKTAQQIANEYPDGVFFVPLAPISAADRVVQTIAEAVKFPLMTQEDPKIQLLRYLRNRQLLLVIDNFEHLLDGVEIVSEILSRAAGVKVLATSREKLNLISEQLVFVGGMDFSLPGRPPVEQRNDASTLFVQSALKINPGFDPESEQLVQIESICQMVMGMPLAIELAAAWLQVLTLEEISTEINQDLDILSTDARDAPRRHRSLRAVFEHSWKLLENSEREILMSLSIFRGGFTRQAAQQVTGASLQQLMVLVSKSFLHHDSKSGRLTFHELLRQYALEELRSDPRYSTSAHEAHASYYADFMDVRWQQLKGERQLTALAEIETDLENVRAAWKYYLEPFNPPQIWKFMYSLWFVHWVRGWYLVGSEMFAEAARPQGEGQDAALRAFGKALQAYFLAWLDRSPLGFKLAEESVKVLQPLDYPEALILAIDSLIVNAYFLDRLEAFNYTQEMLDVAHEHQDKWLITFVLFANSMAALVRGDYTEARRQSEIHFKLCEEIGDKIHATVSLIVRGHAAQAQEEYEEAWSIYLRCLKLSQETGFFYSLQTVTKYLGKTAISMGKLDDAEDYLVQCLVMTKEIGFVRDVINLYYEFARLTAARGNPYHAVELLAYVIQHPASTQSRMMEGRIRDSALELLNTLQRETLPEEFSAAIKRGQDKEIDQIFNALVV